MENEQSLQFLKIFQKDISQLIRKKKADCTVIADEISFYATKNLSAGLATHAGFGVNYILQLQDLGQISDENLRSAILTNCSVKLFYKISDKLTLEYVEKLGGDELVTNYSFTGVEHSYSQTVEPLLNATRVRAMWYKQNAILIAEYFNTAFFISTSFIPDLAGMRDSGNVSKVCHVDFYSSIVPHGAFHANFYYSSTDANAGIGCRLAK